MRQRQPEGPDLPKPWIEIVHNPARNKKMTLIDTPMLWENPNVKSGAETIDPADVGRPEDIAAVIAYLLSDDAQFVQGAMVRVDGGRLNRL